MDFGKIDFHRAAVAAGCQQFETPPLHGMTRKLAAATLLRPSQNFSACTLNCAIIARQISGDVEDLMLAHHLG